MGDYYLLLQLFQQDVHQHTAARLEQTQKRFI